MVGEGAVLSPITVYPTALTTVGITVGGQPETIPPTGQTSVGITVGGQPDTIPPTGQTSAGITTGGQPETIPPTGQTSAGITVAGTTTPIPPSAQPLTLTAGAPITAQSVAGDDQGTICIAALGATMNAQVAPLFGRAPYFLLVGLGTFKVIPNPNIGDRTGVGVQSAQLVVSEGARVVIANDLAVKAMEELMRLRVQVYTGVTGTAAQAVEWYQSGRLTPATLSTSSVEEEEEHGQSSSKAKSKGESSSSKSL